MDGQPIGHDRAMDERTSLLVLIQRPPLHHTCLLQLQDFGLHACGR